MPKIAATQLEKDTKRSKAAQPQADGLALGEFDLSTATSSARVMDSFTPRQVMALQRTVGNQAVQRMLARPSSATAPEQSDLPSPLQPAPVLPLGDGWLSGSPSVTEPVLQRTPVSKISSFGASGGASVIQRQTILASKPGHIHEIKGTLNGDAKAKIRAIRKAKKRQKYNRFDDIEIDDDQSKHIVDGKGTVVWYQIDGSPNQFVLAAKVLTNFQAGPTKKEVEDSDPELNTVSKSDLSGTTGDIVNEVDSAMVDVLRGYTLKEDLRGEELTDSESTTQTQTTTAEGVSWAMGGALGMLNGILGMASSLKDLTSSEKTTWEKVEAAFNLIASGSDVIGSAEGISGGIAQIVNNYSTEGTKQYTDSESVSGWAFGFQSMFSTLSGGIKSMLDIITLIKMLVQQIRDKETFDRDEWLDKAGSLLTNALETAKGIVTSIRVIWELVNDAVTGVFEAVVPGIDIAISAVKTLFQGYYLAKSAFHWFRMIMARRKAQKNLKKQGFTKQSIKEARKFYRHREGIISNTEHLIGKNTKAINKRDKKITKSKAKSDSRFKWVNKRRKNERRKWRAQIRDLSSENVDVTGRRDLAQQEITKFEQNQIDSSGTTPQLPGTGDDTGDDTGSSQSSPTGVPQPSKPIANPSRLALSELNLSSELSMANAKRVLRQSIHIGTNLVKIAGSIVTIVAGTGAPAGVALKAAAAGVDISLPFFRSLKQFGRNKAGKAQAKGKKNFFTKVFNPTKSNIAKLEHRKRQAVTILMMVADLNNYLPTANDKPTRDRQRKKLAKRAQHVERYMYAAGVSPKKLYRANGKPAEQVKLLVEAMCKRELFS